MSIDFRIKRVEDKFRHLMEEIGRLEIALADASDWNYSDENRGNPFNLLTVHQMERIQNLTERVSDVTTEIEDYVQERASELSPVFGPSTRELMNY